MKQKLFFKSLLVAAGLLLGQSAWAYEVPDGMEIKNVYIGTNNDETIIAEDFADVSVVPAGWTYDLNSIGITSVEEVAKGEVGTSIAVSPTYVSGNCLQAYLRKGTTEGWKYATYTFDAVSTNKLVFSADFFANGNVNNSAMYLQFLDSDDNLVLTLAPYTYSSSKQGNFGYAIGDGELTSIASTNSLWPSYPGYGIKDLVIDFSTGETSFTLDFTERSSGTWHRAQRTVDINIGTGKNISKFRIGKKSLSSTDIYFYIDNIELYTVGTASGSHNYTIKATADEGNTELELLASGACSSGSTYSVQGINYVIVKDGHYYVLDDNNVSNYGISYTMGDSDENKTINYTEDTNIVYYTEGPGNYMNLVEDTNCSGGSYTTTNTSTNQCNARNRGFNVGSLEAGSYIIWAFVKENNSRKISVRINDGSTYNTDNNPIAEISGGSTGLKKESFYLDSSQSIVLTGSNNGDTGSKSNHMLGFDYIVIKKINNMSIVGDFSENGWTTESGVAMTQDSENPAVWTAVINDFEVNSTDAYQYKIIANGKWGDYELPASGNKSYTFYSTGTYDLYFTANTSEHTYSLVAEKQVDYTVVGCFNNNETASFFGTTWDVANTDNNLVSNGDGTYSKTYYGVSLEVGTIYYKVVEDHAWTSTWGFGDNNADYYVGSAGTYDITFTFNPSATLSGSSYHLGCALSATPSTVAKTITEAGYATYYSNYPLDFSESGLTAYIAKAVGANISFIEVTSVPAKTGVLLKGNADNHDIKVVASSSTDVSSNVFVGVDEATEVAAGIFVLMNDTQGKGFYKTKNAFTVGANTAYLPAYVASGRSFIGIDEGETTGIEDVRGQKVEVSGEYFDLQGRKVAQPAKGLYIKNGKKVIIK